MSLSDRTPLILSARSRTRSLVNRIRESVRFCESVPINRAGYICWNVDSIGPRLKSSPTISGVRNRSNWSRFSTAKGISVSRAVNAAMFALLLAMTCPGYLGARLPVYCSGGAAGAPWGGS